MCLSAPWSSVITPNPYGRPHEKSLRYKFVTEAAILDFFLEITAAVLNLRKQG